MQYTLTVNTKPRTQDEANTHFIIIEIVKKLDKMYPDYKIFFVPVEDLGIGHCFLLPFVLQEANSKHTDILYLRVHIPTQDPDLFMRSEPTLSRKCSFYYGPDGTESAVHSFFNEAHIEMAKIIDKTIIKIKQQKTDK
jgi:hypothetical protein